MFLHQNDCEVSIFVSCPGWPVSIGVVLAPFLASTAAGSDDAGFYFMLVLLGHRSLDGLTCRSICRRKIEILPFNFILSFILKMSEKKII